MSDKPNKRVYCYGSGTPHKWDMKYKPPRCTECGEKAEK